MLWCAACNPWCGEHGFVKKDCKFCKRRKKMAVNFQVKVKKTVIIEKELMAVVENGVLNLRVGGGLILTATRTGEIYFYKDEAEKAGLDVEVE